MLGPVAPGAPGRPGPRQAVADRVLQRVVVVQQRRGPEELQRPQAGVAEQVDQGDVAEPEADLGDDQADLRQRGERQGAT